MSPQFGDPVFDNGMLADLTALGDSKTGEDAWTRSFLENDIDGVILVAGDNINGIVDRLFKIKDGLQMGKSNSGCRELFMLDGHTRPGYESGHEQYVHVRSHGELSDHLCKVSDSWMASPSQPS